MEKRLKRWLKNSRVDVEACCQQFIVWLWSRCETERPILLVDETKLGKRIGSIVIALAFDKRAIPIMWRCYIANSKAGYPDEGQVQMIVTMLEKVIACLPDECRPSSKPIGGLVAHPILLKRANSASGHICFVCKKRVS